MSVIKQKYTLAILGILMLLISCNNDELYFDYPKCKLLQEVASSPIFTDISYPHFEYQYDGKKLIKRFVYDVIIFAGTEEDTENIVKTLIDSIIYDDQNRVYEIFHYPEDWEINVLHQRFFYNYNKIELVSSVLYNFENSVISKSDEKFKYSVNGLLSESKKNTTSVNGTIKNERKIYEYSDLNLSKITTLTSYDIDSTYAYTFGYIDTDSVYFSIEIFDNYDENENPYAGFFMIDELRNQSLSKNNYQYYEARLIEFFSSSHIISEKKSLNTNSSAYPTNMGLKELIYDCDD